MTVLVTLAILALIVVGGIVAIVFAQRDPRLKAEKERRLEAEQELDEVTAEKRVYQRALNKIASGSATPVFDADEALNYNYNVKEIDL